MLEDDNGFELMEPASPESLVPGHGLWPWFAAAAAVVVLLAIAWLVFRKRKPAGPDLMTIRRAAFNEASAAMDAIIPGTVRETAVLASLILRKYLSAAAGDPALFETHEEFVSRRDSLQALTPDARGAAGTGFTRLAALKYAPDIPEAEPAQVLGESRTLLETLHRGFAA